MVRARLTKTNLEGTNFGGADLNMAAFGMNEDLLKVSRAIVILHITANNFLFQRIIYDRIKQRFIMIDNEYESDDEKISKLLIEFVLLINSSRLARLSLKLMRILFNLIGPKASHLDVTYDEITINSLLNAKNLDKAEFYGPIKRDLIDRSRDIVNDPDTDLELKESLKNFLASSDVDENQTANELNL